MKIEVTAADRQRAFALVGEVIEALRPIWRPADKENGEHTFDSELSLQLEAAARPVIAKLPITDCVAIYPAITSNEVTASFGEGTLSGDACYHAHVALMHRVLDDEAETVADVTARLQFIAAHGCDDDEGVYKNDRDGDGVINGIQRSIQDIERLTGSAQAERKAA